MCRASAISTPAIGTLIRNSQRQLQGSNRSAEQGPEQKRQPERRADQPEHAAAPLERHRVGDHGRGDREDPPAPKAWIGAAGQQHGEVRCAPATSREPHGEHSEALHEHRAPALAVGTLREQRRPET